jgi:hypothetical protein
MAPPSKKKPLPTTQNVEYFFCSNAFCNYHASFLLGTRPPESGLTAGGTCPQCHTGQITLFNLAQASTVPLVPNAVGVVLPALPYGGLPLRLGDQDNKSLWGGQTASEPQHQGAQYVRELQRDLLRLAFYGPARGGETPGVFSPSLMGGVLDLKRHLIDDYGVPTSDDLSNVTSLAVSAMLAERFSAAGAGGQPTVLPAPTGPIDATVPIFYPPKGLANPNEVYNSVPSWTKTLGAPTGGTGTLVQTFESWAALWESTNLATAAQAAATQPNAQAAAKLKRDIKRRDDAASLILGQLKSLDLDVDQARSGAALINAEPSQGTPTSAFVQLRANALSSASTWVQQPGPGATPTTRPTTAGTLPALLLRMTALQARWAALNPPLGTPPEWPIVQQGIGQLIGTLTAYRDEVQRSNATTFMGTYLKLLQDFGQVDLATARYIRRMSTDGVLAGIPVFRTPMGLPKGATGTQELIDFVSSNAQVLASTVNAVVAEAQFQRADAPNPIIDFIFRHEGGSAHTANYGDRLFVKLGIDWNNPGDRSSFNPNTTSGKKPSFSRGWGVSQQTFFSRPVPGLVLADTSSGTVQPGATPPAPGLSMNAGIPVSKSGAPPIPMVVASGIENAKIGIRTYLQAFQSTKNGTHTPNECTFIARHDCVNCVKNLQLGSPQLDAKGNPLRKGGMRFFNEAEGDFERVIVNKQLSSHRFRSLARVQQLLSPPTTGATPLYAIQGKTAATVDDDDCLEFPCSWLTAVTRYAGAGEIAWYFALHAIFTLQTDTL